MPTKCGHHAPALRGAPRAQAPAPRSATAGERLSPTRAGRRGAVAPGTVALLPLISKERAELSEQALLDGSLCLLQPKGLQQPRCPTTSPGPRSIAFPCPRSRSG